MLGAVNKLIQQNAFLQPNAEKKATSSSEDRSDFGKALESSNKKIEKFEKVDAYEPKKFDQRSSEEKVSKQSNLLQDKQPSIKQDNELSEASYESESVDSSNLPNPGKLTPGGGERISPSGEIKEGNYVNTFYQNNPYKVDSQKSQNQEEISGDDLTKKLALQTFMKRMKDELGVEPSRLMKAFASLSMEELTRPPEENVGKIIQSLNLDPQQQLVAQQIFNDMLKQTASQSMASYLKSSGRDLSLSVMTSKEIKQNNLSRSLDNMNDKFFMKNAQLKNPELSAKEEGTSEHSSMAANSFTKATAAGTGSAAGMNSLANASAASAAQATPAAMAPMNAQQMQSVIDQMPELSVQERSQLQEQLKDILAQNPQALKQQSLADTLQSGSLQTPAKAESMVAGGAALGVGALSMLGGDEDSFEESATSEDGQSMDMGKLLAAQHSQSAQVGDKKDISFATAMDGQVLQQVDSANVKELINQAQFLARRGGGEMKIKLNPEGLGEVNMNVTLHEGQLQVQMVTDSNEAKKMIERGLGELKATLAAHSLNVDQIRVDSTQTSLDKQMAQYQEESQRQSARQFMQQFRDDNSAWKRNFYDINPARSYRSQRDEATHPTIPVQAMSDRSKATSKRLNLVA